jgi:hypothetical protein
MAGQPPFPFFFSEVYHIHYWTGQRKWRARRLRDNESRGRLPVRTAGGEKDTVRIEKETPDA